MKIPRCRVDAPDLRRAPRSGLRPALVSVLTLLSLWSFGSSAEVREVATPRLQPGGNASRPQAGLPGPLAQRANGAGRLNLRLPGAGSESDSDGPLPSVELTSPVLFQILAAEIAAQRGQTGSAAATLLSLARQTRDPRLARRATEISLSDRSLDRALQSAQLWYELAPDSSMSAQTLETLWIASGRFADAEPLVRARQDRARQASQLEDFYQQLERSLLRSTEHAAALGLMQRIAAADPVHPASRIALAGVAAAAGDAELAARESLAAHRARPEDEQIVMAAARFAQSASGGNAAALALLKNFLEAQPRASEARFLYARMLNALGDAGTARQQMERALVDDPDNPAILYGLAQIAWQTGQPDLAQSLLRKLVELPATVPRDNSAAWLFLAQMAEERGQLEEALEQLGKVTRSDQRLGAVLRRAQILGRLGRLEAARELLRSTSVDSPRERAQLLASEAQVLREAGRVEEALALLGAALERQPDSVELLYDHAMTAERLNRLDVMEAGLRRLIALRPDYAHAYNALGYSLADRNLRLDEAHALITRALALAPDDPHILDSMGWVLFRLGQPERALEPLRRAVAIRPDIEVTVHLGEVLWTLGRTDEARRLWREAQGREPGNTVLRDTLARLNVAL